MKKFPTKLSPNNAKTMHFHNFTTSFVVDDSSCIMLFNVKHNSTYLEIIEKFHCISDRAFQLKFNNIFNQEPSDTLLYYNSPSTPGKKCWMCNRANIFLYECQPILCMTMFNRIEYMLVSLNLSY